MVVYKKETTYYLAELIKQDPTLFLYHLIILSSYHLIIMSAPSRLQQHNMSCAHGHIAPQALPPSGDTIRDDPFHYESFDGMRVNYAQVNQRMNRVNRFPIDHYVNREYAPDVNLSIYDSNLVCNKGVSNVDNSCVCPGSGDTMPFNTQTHDMHVRLTNQLFSPFVPNSIPELTPAAKEIIRQRQPLPPGVGSFYQFDMPLPCGQK